MTRDEDVARAQGIERVGVRCLGRNAAGRHNPAAHTPAWNEAQE